MWGNAWGRGKEKDILCRQGVRIIIDRMLYLFCLIEDTFWVMKNNNTLFTVSALRPSNICNLTLLYTEWSFKIEKIYNESEAGPFSARKPAVSILPLLYFTCRDYCKTMRNWFKFTNHTQVFISNNKKALPKTVIFVVFVYRMFRQRGQSSGNT
jgi:hypothetical protein